MRCGTVAVVWCLGFVGDAAGQGSGTACKNLSYQNRNQVDYGPFQVATILGNAKDAQGVAIPKVCVGVFTESDHKFLAATETDDSGHFELKHIPNGDYRLVANYEGFSPANAKLRVERRKRSKKPLVVQMRSGGLDSVSYVELK